MISFVRFVELTFEVEDLIRGIFQKTLGTERGNQVESKSEDCDPKYLRIRIRTYREYRRKISVSQLATNKMKTQLVSGRLRYLDTHRLAQTFPVSFSLPSKLPFPLPNPWNLMMNPHG
jgi:hypothetical protein